MMKIKKLYAVPGVSGYYNKDFRAIREGRDTDGFVYSGKPIADGFDSVVQPGQSISILLELDDGQVAWGDCVDVIFAGSAGRDKIFRSKDHVKIIESEIKDLFVEKELSTFREMDLYLENLKINGKSLHTAVLYGMSQALLDAVAKANHITMTEVICKEYGLTLPDKTIPMAAMTPTNQRINIDKMILKEVDYFPHASFANVERDLGPGGEKILEYINWVSNRIKKIGRTGYNPVLHLDLYGTLGQVFDNNISAIVDFLRKLSSIAEPYNFILETPIIAKTQEEQLDLFTQLRIALEKEKINIPIIVDEWCNTLEDIKLFADSESCDFIQVKVPDLGVVNKSIEAALYCKEKGKGVYIGGSANETDQSARISTHIALATQADILIVKPGQGTDEGLVIEYNEILRTLKLIAGRS